MLGKAWSVSHSSAYRYKQLKPEEFAAGKYNINVGGDIKVMVGDGTFKGIAGDISDGNISQNIN
nr:hypothetical protein [Microcystis sp. M090S1]